MNGNWDTYGKCECGFMKQAPFKSLFHIHLEVCPQCGADKSKWKLVTARAIHYGFLGLSTKYEIKEEN